MREQEAKHEQLQIDYLAAVRVREQILQERAALQRTADENRSTVDSLTDQLGRYKAIEQRLFDEKQSYQSKFEALQEEKAKLAKVVSPFFCNLIHKTPYFHICKWNQIWGICYMQMCMLVFYAVISESRH